MRAIARRLLLARPGLETPGRRSLPWLVSIAIAGQFASAGLSTIPALAGLCGPSSASQIVGTTSLAFSVIPLSWFALAWGIMLIAMMPPLIASPLDQLLATARSHDEARAVASFSLAYAALWMATGMVVVPLSIAIKIGFEHYAVPITVALSIIWMLSPLARRARANCLRPLTPSAGDRGAIIEGCRQGGILGFWCVLLCWPWMMVVMVAAAWHVLLMAFVTLFLMWERSTMFPAARSSFPQGLSKSSNDHWRDLR